MKKISRKLLSFFLLLISVFILTSCKASPKLKKESIKHELEFGGVYVTITIDDFNKLGFEYGDSLDVSFSNGYKLDDIPYYNGYYSKTGEPLVVAYPGYEYIKVCINNGDDLFIVAKLDEEDTATIKINEKNKYLDIQNARDIHYYDEREKYDSDIMFANFRSIMVTGLKNNILYRSASPCDNQHKRAPYVDNLMRDNNISFILNLSDNEDKIKGYISKSDFSSSYFLSLYNEQKVIPIALNMNYQSEDFKKKIVDGLKELIQHDGPYLIHCTEGKDRTGFVCMVLEALVGASYEDIREDYMITYYNYYRIDKTSSKYDIIVFNLLDPMIESMVNDEVDYKTVSLSSYAESFLLSGGMTTSELNTLKNKLMNNN